MKLKQFDLGYQKGLTDARAYELDQLTKAQKENKELRKRLDDKEQNARIQILQSMATIAEATSKALLSYDKVL